MVNVFKLGDIAAYHMPRTWAIKHVDSTVTVLFSGSVDNRNSETCKSFVPITSVTVTHQTVLCKYFHKVFQIKMHSYIHYLTTLYV